MTDTPHGCTIDGQPAMPILISEHTQLVTRLAEAESAARDADRLRRDWVTMRDRAESAEEAARRALAQRQEMAAERYAWQERGDRAEAALARVRALADECEEGGHSSGHPLTVTRIRNALDEPPPVPTAAQATGHHYLSTGCLHGEHGYCSNVDGIAGLKKPAQCKFCTAPCQCPCHGEQPAADPAATQTADGPA
jgi:hypothetical protein